MKCVITGGNIKVFGKSVHSLARIGSELYIEETSAGLVLKTVNSSRSGFASVTFKKEFFHVYVVSEPDVIADDDECVQTNWIKWKVDMKACLAVFKSLPMFEKTVEECIVCSDDTKVVFQLQCKFGVIKRYELFCMERMSAAYSYSDCVNHIEAVPKVLESACQSFQAGLEEITLTVTKLEFSLKNFVDKHQDANKVLHTELKLELNEFEVYDIQNETSITFTMKELRAAVHLSEMSEEAISIHFNEPGKPVIFVIRKEHSFDADFVLATLLLCQEEDDDDNQSESVADERSAFDFPEVETASEDPQRNEFDDPKPSTSAAAAVTSSSVMDKSLSRRSNNATKVRQLSLVSPPHKKSKSMFSVATTPQNQVSFVSEVLASNSEEEEEEEDNF